jgi:prolyl-tRNA synthetase
MYQSKLFTKTRKEAPADEVSKNAQLLIRAGFIHKEMAGVYSYLPLGLKVLKNIEQIIREEMNSIGGMEMRTSALQEKSVWEKTNRWDDNIVDNWFKTSLKNGTELGLSFTNEEAFSSLMKNFVNSYKDLPLYPYDFKTIFRN